MWTSYHDILSRIDEPPSWFDENAVPRFVPFAPRNLASIYASEGVLLLIKCQGCATAFRVAMHNHGAMSPERTDTLAAQIRANTIHFGDPPNTHCCDVGASMNSIPQRVLEYWWRPDAMRWMRDSSLEVSINHPWAR